VTIKQQEKIMDKWMMSAFNYNRPERVDFENGIIYGVSVNTEGEAKGHGVNLDSDFVQRVAEQGNAKKHGLKARFGHPSMSSTALGTFVGRFKNFRVVGTRVLADLFLSKTANPAPSGDLYSYILNMAANEADMFGTSIVFKPGQRYQRNEMGEKDYELSQGDSPIFIEIEELLANDIVDDPAANPGGLFSAFNQDTFAGQVSEFLDLHPHIFELLSKKPEVIDTFLERYNQYKLESQMKVKEIEEVASEDVELEEVEVVEELEAEVEVVDLEADVSEDVELETEVEVEDNEVEELEAVSEEDVEISEKSSFEAIEEKFGTSIAVKALKDGLSFEEAKDLYVASLEAQNEDLLDQMEEYLSSEGVDAVEFSEETVDVQEKEELSFAKEGHKAYIESFNVKG